MQRNYKTLCFIFLIQILGALTGCGLVKVAGCTGDCSSTPYIFPGIDTLVNNNDGTYTLNWEKPPTTEKIDFDVFMREMPTTSGQITTYNFGTADAHITNDVTWKSVNVTFKNNTCFLVRFWHPDAPDTNTKELCTGHKKFVFAGLKTLVKNDNEGWKLGWDKVPAGDVTYYIYERDPKTEFDFTKPLATSLAKDFSYDTRSLKFEGEKCYIVRAASLSNQFKDYNTNEICTTNTKFEFQGIASVSANPNGTWALNWENIKGDGIKYNIYGAVENTDIDYTKLITTADNKDYTINTEVLTFKDPYCYSVRAISNTNQFIDKNVKKICTSQTKYVFPGINKLTNNTDGTWTLSWEQVPATDFVYKIYERPSNGKYDFTKPPLYNPAFKDLTYNTADLTTSEAKCFLVRAVSNVKLFDDANTHELCTGHKPFGNFPGCSGYSVLDSSRIKINFAWPEGASAMSVYRDGISVFSTENKNESSFTDTNLSNTRDYVYLCKAKVNTFSIEGKVSYTLKPLNQSDIPAFEGCASAAGVSTSQIQINYSWPIVPTGFLLQAMHIYRNGVLIKSETNLSATNNTDNGLGEGMGYTYTCKAVINNLEVEGTKSVSAETNSVNPPNFLGIQTATALTASTIKVAWTEPGGNSVPVSKYEVYYNPYNPNDATSLLNPAATPVAALDPTSKSYTITGLGEEMPYVFGVKACSASNNCSFGIYNSAFASTINSSNAATLTKNVTIADSGIAPSSVGATAVTMGNGAANVTAPWDHTKGGIIKRHVYYKTGTAITDHSGCVPSGGQPDIKHASCYPGEKIFTVSNITTPLTSLPVDNLTSSQQYSFVVRDEDTTGHINENWVGVTVNSGDLPPPIFAGGGATLSAGSPTSSALSLSFSAVTPEVGGDVNSGPSYYLVYISEANGLGSPANACTSGTLYTTLDALQYTDLQAVTVPITGRSPRKSYQVCVKAKDAAGNISAANSPATPIIVTQDLTAPSFDNVQSLSWDSANSCLNLSWNPSSATDLKEYKAYIYNTNAPSTVVTKSITADPSSLASYCVNSSDLTPLGGLDDQTLKVYMQACDDAAPNYGVQNCSSQNQTNAISIPIPDNTPPQGFGGITSVAASSPLVTGTNGGLTVNWNVPILADWSTGYRGFKIYDVPCKRNNTPCATITASDLTLLKDCACTQSLCADHIVTCQLTNLSAYKNYNLLVRAYDAYGNQTAVASNAVPIARKSDDVKKPTFTSALSANWVTTSTAPCNIAGNGICLGWTAATDNQFTGTPDNNTLTYKVYRHTSTFTFDGNDLPTNGSVISTGTTTNFQDPASGLTGGVTYYYTVCVQDQATKDSFADAAGMKCDKVIASTSPSDVIAPTINSSSVSKNYITSSSVNSWTISWNITDNSANNTTISIRKIETAFGATTWPDGTETPVYTTTVSLSASTPTAGTSSALSATAALNKRIAYLITATDQNGNASDVTSTSKVEVLVDLRTPSAPYIANVTENALITNYEKIFTGYCDSTGGYTTTVVPITASEGLIKIISTTCASSVLTVKAHFKEGSGARGIIVTTTDGSTPRTLTRNVYFHKPCPVGYIGVPGKTSTDTDITGLGHVSAAAANTTYDLNPTKDFCVMKYPAKAATSDAGGQTTWEFIANGNKSFNTTSYWPESRSSGTPWVNITRDDAIDRCQVLNLAHGLCTSGSTCYSSFDNTQYGFDLISNTQWQVLARNIENTSDNWSNGSALGVGSGVLNMGHSDSTTIASATTYGMAFTANQALANSRWDTNSYFGTGNTGSTWNTLGLTPAAGEEQKRTFYLSTGQIAWDVSGNVWQWIKDNSYNSIGASVNLKDNGAGYLEYNSSTFLDPVDKLLFGPSVGSYSSAHNVGFVKAGSGSTAGIARGGSYSTSTNTGVFTAFYLASSDSAVGFRCTYLPAAPNLSDATIPTVASIHRVDSLGNASNSVGTSLAGNPTIAVATGGSWNLKWTIADTGDTNEKLYVQIRRKITTTNSDFPTNSDTIYQEGFNLTSLYHESAWTMNSDLTYSRNDGKYVNYLITVIDPNGNVSTNTNATFSVTNTQSCPPGYVGVPGKASGDADNAGLGLPTASAVNGTFNLNPTQSFCVMKYSAKAATANTSTAQNTIGGKYEPIHNKNAGNDNTKYIPESRVEGIPIRGYSFADAESACNNLGTIYGVSTFHAINNTQFQVISRNIENIAANWSNGIAVGVGSGVINRGNSDNSVDPNATINSWEGVSGGEKILSNSRTDTNYYFATGNSSGTAWASLGTSPAVGREQKRTFVLSNGEILWDIAGNAYTVIADDATVFSSNLGHGGFVEFSTLNAANANLFGPSNYSTYGTATNFGAIFKEDGAFSSLRGGAYNDTTNAGIFSFLASSGSAALSGYQTFRCVFEP